MTGGNTGIGRATCTELARRGGRVFVAARSRAKGEAAVAGIRAATGNEAVFFLPLDLADLDSVRACAGAFLARGEPLHVLVNNAGVAGRRGRVPWPVRPLIQRRMLSVTDGAVTSVYCATSAEVATSSGLFYDRCAPRAASPVATPELGRLWDRSQSWVGKPAKHS